MLIRKIINYIFKLVLIFYKKIFYLVMPHSLLKRRSQQLIEVSLNEYNLKSYNIDKVDKNNFNNLINNSKKVVNISKSDLNTAIDIGANFGFYSCALSNVGFKSIYSLEPNPNIFKIMEENFSRNNLSNIISLPYGIYNESKELGLSYPALADKQLDKKTDKYSSGTLSLKGSGKDIIIAKFKKFKDIPEFQNLDKCDLIKINVEGSEIEVLKEIEPILKKFKPVIIMEFNINYLNRNNFEIIKNIIIKNNYTNFLIFSDDNPKIISNELDFFVNQIFNKKIGSKDIVFLIPIFDVIPSCFFV